MQLLEDMTSTKDILNADAKKYMEDLKAFEKKYKRGTVAGKGPEQEIKGCNRSE